VAKFHWLLVQLLERRPTLETAKDTSIMSVKWEIDDDPDFTENQIVFGKIGAQTVATAVAQCARIAKAVYGANGSSGLRNIVQNSNSKIVTLFRELGDKPSSFSFSVQGRSAYTDDESRF
jgi:hypothetical protein